MCVPKRTLTDIESQYQGLERRKEEVLHAWLKGTPGASWKELVNALRQIDEKALAARLEDKYCQPPFTQNGNYNYNKLNKM